MFKEPLAVFTADFGETVLIDGAPVRAIFDRDYAPDNAFGFAVANADPQLLAADADLPANIRQAIISVRGKTYTVAEVDADGTGMSTIQLRGQHGTPTY